MPTPVVAVVDDDRDYLSLMELLLGDEAGCSVVTICDGNDSPDRLGNLRPSLIVMDLLNPRSGYGWRSLELLTEDPATQGIPILLCSGATHELSGRDEWLKARGIAVIRKPFDVDEMIDMVRRLVGSDASPRPHVSTST